MDQWQETYKRQLQTKSPTENTMPEPLAQLLAAHHLRHVSVKVIIHMEMLLFHPNVHSQQQCIGSCTQVTRKQ